MSSERDVRVAMDDGVELDVTLWLPDPAGGPQPCLLEALPYRKDDLTASNAAEYVLLRDEHHYAVCRADVRGTGSSGGDAVDEYPPREQADLVTLIDWLSRQPWCDGSVGMFGTSYSGFNALQVACERPPALKAICAIYATDDRWTDDVHWRGGARKLVDLIDYCHYMTAMNALPPVPHRWGRGWQGEWRRRVDTCEPWLLTWLSERADGAYWRHGSLRPHYARIACPVLLVAGWADGYRNNSFRTVAALRDAGVPHRLLAGPWAHADPATAMPGPRIDLLREQVAWWDRWLRGRDNGVDEQTCTIFVRSSTVPEPALDLHDGFWIREQWPCPRVSVQVRDLDDRPAYPVRADVGTAAWIDCAGHLPWGQSDDQRLDDAVSMTWDWPAGEVVLLGHPRVRLQVSSDRPRAALSVKLCDVFADGTSALVTRGSRALDRLEPGRVHEVEVELDACAYAFAPRQRLRVAVAGADWPNTVAPPEPVSLIVHGGTVELPVWSGPSPHLPPRLAPGAEHSAEDAAGVVWRIERDVLRGETACVVEHGSTSVGPGGEATEHYRGRVSVDTRTFVQRAEADVTFVVRWLGGGARTRSTLDVRVGRDAYDVAITLEAHELPAGADGDPAGGALVGERRWERRLPR
ncbi:MAG: CocE/NonD family hydrolase [Nocardioidaceae bacterium]|nr:CocE/NonD family hydrolase [Nocardioidaceae bacterium]